MKADFTEEFNRQEKADSLMLLKGKTIIAHDLNRDVLRAIRIDMLSVHKIAVKIIFLSGPDAHEWVFVDQFDNRFQFIDDVDAN